MRKINTVRTVIYDTHNEVLLGQRPFTAKQRAGQLDLFGGQVEAGETLEDAARREVQEETGFDTAELAMRPLFVRRDVDAEATYMRHYFAARVDSFPKEILAEHVGSVIMPLVVAAASLQFEPHREAISRLLGQ